MIGDVAMPPDATIDLRQENLLARIHRALRAIVLRENRLIRVGRQPVSVRSPTIEMWVHERGLSRTCGNSPAISPGCRWRSPG